MDSFELNKLIGGLLGTVFVVFSVALVSDALFASPAPEKPGYAIEAAEEPAEGGAAAGPAEPKPIAELLPTASVEKGQAIFKKCQACHSGEKGGPNKVGPDLWDIVDRPVAEHEGFSYSAGMKDFSKGGTEKWTYDHLYHFLISPKAFVKGTAMGFAGLKKDEDRADVIAYLRTLSDSPKPLPEAAAPAADASKPADAKPADASKPADAKPADAKPAEGEKPAAPAQGEQPAQPAQ
ncbi:cytochrome c family protein [Mesorhizobium sp. CN5-321]|jgi:cytochrome c|uniref:c-type cytochrome n=1 Tax=Mesorhizobium hunchu TaxID=3157708 RepID=UPI0032B71D75